MTRRIVLERVVLGKQGTDGVLFLLAADTKNYLRTLTVRLVQARHQSIQASWVH
jgi:hypothetical protein